MDRYPRESRGLGPAGDIGIVEGVNDSSAKLVEGFVPTRYELKILAVHYLNQAREIEYCWEESGQVGSNQGRLHPFCYARAAMIRDLLGTEEFEKATRSIDSHWDEKIKDLIDNSPRCESCGARLHLFDTDGRCVSCRSELKEISQA